MRERENMNNNLSIEINKAEGSGRGDGWYYLINGIKDGHMLRDVGGEDWFSSRKSARAAARDFVANCSYDPEIGWTI